MNYGLIRRGLRELAGVTLVLSLVVCAFEAILAYVLPTFSQRFSAQIAQIEVMQTMIKAMLGVDAPGAIGKEMFWAIAWAHPVVLAVSWAHAIIACTRVPAGEVDRGTIDVLMGLPVSRTQLFLSETAAWLITGAILMIAAALGNFLGRSQVAQDMRSEPARVATVVPLFFCLYISVGGMAWLASCLSDRRGKAMSVGFLIVIVSFLLNYLAQFWSPAKNVEFLSILYYYRPYQVLRDGAFPWRDAAILLGGGALLWLAGGLVLSRRDLAAL